MKQISREIVPLEIQTIVLQEVKGEYIRKYFIRDIVLEVSRYTRSPIDLAA